MHVLNNKVFWVCIVGLLALNVLGFGVFKIVVKATTDAVIQRLQKDYSPSPYSPGFDPDRVNPDAFRQQTQQQQRFAQEVDFRPQWEAMRGN